MSIENFFNARLAAAVFCAFGALCFSVCANAAEKRFIRKGTHVVSVPEKSAQLGGNSSTGANAAAGGISANANALDIFGKWSIPDDENPDAPQSIVLFYKKSDGTAAAKMIAIYHNGKIDDTEATPKERAKKINGHPFLCGYDFIHSLIPNAQRSRFAGKVVDPDSGKTYDCEVWFDARRNVLVVRGELLIFGVNQYWPKTGEDVRLRCK